MARITVEDCLENAANRFELVLIASKRARQIARGAEPLLEEENDKPTVLALREIAAGKIDASLLDEPEETGLDEAEFAAEALGFHDSVEDAEAESEEEVPEGQEEEEGEDESGDETATPGEEPDEGSP